jgi:exopolysaccharide biosynthesis polyprenyl glycosylphosphotransferase
MAKVGRLDKSMNRFNKTKTGLLIFDFLAITAGIYLAFLLRFQVKDLNFLQPNLYEVFFLFSIFYSGFYLFGAYDHDLFQKTNRIFWRIINVYLFVFLMVTAMTYVFGLQRSEIFGRGFLALSTSITAFFATISRISIFFFSKTRPSERSLFIIGNQEQQLNALPARCVWINTTSSEFRSRLEFLKATQPFESHGILILYDLSSLEAELNHLLLRKRLDGFCVYTLQSFVEEKEYKVPLSSLDANWFIQSSGFYSVHSKIRLRLKRILDFHISFILILIFSPVMLIAAVAIRLNSKGPLFYKQIRTGLNDELFTIYKFRSMVVDAESSGAQWAQKNDPRVTTVGHFLRKTRIDELPQIYNVLKGDMSFIGPRPERPEFNKNLSAVIPFYDLRHAVLPGITGWAQILYPYGASIEDAKRKFEYDMYYVKHHSFWLDFIILFKTIFVVIKAAGR